MVVPSYLLTVVDNLLQDSCLSRQSLWFQSNGQSVISGGLKSESNSGDRTRSDLSYLYELVSGPDLLVMGGVDGTREGLVNCPYTSCALYMK